jgi:Icc-related predicted phosphoesterase
MRQALFVTDLHGDRGRYESLMAAILAESPDAVFIGGDLLPASIGFASGDAPADFVNGFLVPAFSRLRDAMEEAFPAVFILPGNDDARCEEEALIGAESLGIWRYAHMRRAGVGGWSVYGYACVPPTPFLLKDWERYDVSRYVDPGAVSPEEGFRTVPRAADEIRNGTIAGDLAALAGDDDLTRAIFLFHAPPYDTPLDRADLDGRTVDHAPVDVHVGSIAVRRFIESRRPAVTLHGHVHEACRLTGEWKVRIGDTVAINGAHDGPELALVSFDPERADEARRRLIRPDY